MHIFGIFLYPCGQILSLSLSFPSQLLSPHRIQSVVRAIDSYWALNVGSLAGILYQVDVVCGPVGYSVVWTRQGPRSEQSGVADVDTRFPPQPKSGGEWRQLMIIVVFIGIVLCWW